MRGINGRDFFVCFCFCFSKHNVTNHSYFLNKRSKEVHPEGLFLKKAVCIPSISKVAGLAFEAFQVPVLAEVQETT